MTKRKKRKKRQRSPRRPSANLMRKVAAAMALHDNGETGAAKQQLLQLANQHPRSKPVLLALIGLCQDIEDWRNLAFYGERLYPLERGEDQADTLNNLVYAHIQLLYPALAWYYAKELVRRHPNFEHVEQIKSSIDTIEVHLLEPLEEIDSTADFTYDKKLDLVVQHDRIRFYTEAGHAQDSIPIAEAVLKKAPDLIPVLNNLSLSYYAVGDREQAIKTAQKVLTYDSDNFHALGNLVRYTFLTARFDQAQAYAMRLQPITGDFPELETKKAEAFAFLGDDEQVWAAYEQTQAKSNPPTPLLLHLAAVASYRLGNEKKAWQLWKKAVKLSPSFDMAQDSLAEKRLPVGKRDVPWYWSLQYWIPHDFEQELVRFLGKEDQTMSKKAVERGMKSLLAERPFLSQLFPHMLERGDRATREIVLTMVRTANNPGLLQMLYNFAQSQYGADDFRFEALQFISQHYPEMLPENRQVPAWVNGQQTELLMIGFEITDKPMIPPDIPDDILDKHEVVYDLISDNELETAEEMLHEIIAAKPDFYQAYNQLALTYERQGRRQEARTLMEETHKRFPDYSFARIGLSRILCRENRIEEAKDMLMPLFARPELHISEFRALAAAQMDIALADNQTDAARIWLNMWRQIEDGNPELIRWQRRIDGPGKLLRRFKKMRGK